MTTVTESREALRHAQDQRWKLRSLFRVDEAKASLEDKALLERFRAISTPEKYDKALASKQVNELFRRGVIGVGERNG